MADPRTIEEWLKLAARHERSANLLVEDREASAEAYHHAGFACEAAIKAYIFHIERPNNWIECANSLRTHDLYSLAGRAGLMSTTSPISASLMTVIQWNRMQGYDPNPMPRKVARSMLQAAFSEKGVVTWIRKAIRPSL